MFNPKLKKAAAVFFLGEMLINLVWPLAGYALTTGPNQTEYTSYESADATDMVDLISGDFNYNLPFVEVPGPEGAFKVPIFYHSGIGLEDEASWASEHYLFRGT